MHVSEFTKPVTANKLNESLAKRFGQKIKIENFTTEQLQDARNKIRTKLSQFETNESFDQVHNETYQKSKLMLDVLNAALSERSDVVESTDALREGAEDHAELVMAAKDMVDRITGWMEDTAEMQTESMLELADAIRDEMGQAQSESFVSSVKPALDSLYDALEQTRISLNSGVGMLTGEGNEMGGDMMGGDDMGDMGDMEPTVGDDDMMSGDTDASGDFADDGDAFGAADVAAGGEEDAGREKRESIERIASKVKRENVNPRKLASTLSKKK